VSPSHRQQAHRRSLPIAGNANVVLVVEDSAEIREVLVDQLEAADYEVLSAPDGESALKLLASCKFIPGAIVLDLAMPRHDGHAFRQAQLDDPRWADIPVVVITGDDNLERTKIASLKPHAVIAKPFEIEQLLEVIGSFFPFQRRKPTRH